MARPIRRRLKAIRRYLADLEDPRQTVASRAEGRLLVAIPRLRRSRQVVVDLLLAATAHPVPHVRYRAVWALGATRSPRAYPTILARLQDPDERVRYDATMALGRFGYVQAVEPLIDLIELPASRAFPQAGDRLLHSARRSGMLRKSAAAAAPQRSRTCVGAANRRL